ncbi:MAG: four helix bundle protein [Bacilli bacterium]|jgi:hypothetical protein
MIYYAYDLLLKYPKSERFALVVDIKNIIYEGMRDVIKIQKELDYGVKIKYLHELDVNLKLLKVFVRLSFKRKYISEKNYEVWSRHITHISNLMGGLIKHAKNNKE